MNNVRFVIEESPMYNRVRIWAIEDGPIKRYNIGFDGKTGLLEKEVVEEAACWRNDDSKSLIDLPLPLFRQLSTFILDNRVKLRIIPKEESFTKGKLEATDSHLKDIQDINKKILTLLKGSI